MFHQSTSQVTNPAAPEVSDTALVARAKAGELDAFEALTNRYEQRVYSLALRMLRQEQDAEDVTQQTFLSGGSPYGLYESGYMDRGRRGLCGLSGPQTPDMGGPDRRARLVEERRPRH
jgi:hypothetical protein